MTLNDLEWLSKISTTWSVVCGLSATAELLVCLSNVNFDPNVQRHDPANIHIYSKSVMTTAITTPL